jgi:hypothetical protein
MRERAVPSGFDFGSIGISPAAPHSVQEPS